MQFSAGLSFSAIWSYTSLAWNFAKFVNIIIYRMAITGVIIFRKEIQYFY